MSLAQLTCPRCGAPLPLAATTRAFAECAFCQSAISIPGAHEVLPGLQEATEARTRFIKAVVAGIAAGGDAYAVLRDAAAERLGPIGQSDAVARVTLAMAHDFEQQSGASILNDGNALSRLADGYLKATIELRSAPESLINLPFLTATNDGPKHFELLATPAVFAALAAREPGKPPARPRATPAARPEPDGSPPPKKRGWWPF